jgi:phosphopantetheinyl transferase (holo-ACP synthase)
MIGNDIVDLAVARRESRWQRRGYLDKLFTAGEQLLIRQAPDPERQLWLLWTCKEAAYKAWSTEFEQRCFAPRRLEIQHWTTITPHNSYRTQVRTAERTYTVHAETTADYVRAATQLAPVVLQQQTQYYYPHRNTRKISAELRKRARQSCALRYDWSEADIHISQNELGRPILHYQGSPTDIYLSWAHHGRWAELLIGQAVRLPQL